MQADDRGTESVYFSYITLLRISQQNIVLSY